MVAAEPACERLEGAGGLVRTGRVGRFPAVVAALRVGHEPIDVVWEVGAEDAVLAEQFAGAPRNEEGLCVEFVEMDAGCVDELLSVGEPAHDAGNAVAAGAADDPLLGALGDEPEGIVDGDGVWVGKVERAADGGIVTGEGGDGVCDEVDGDRVEGEAGGGAGWRREPLGRVAEELDEEVGAIDPAEFAGAGVTEDEAWPVDRDGEVVHGAAHVEFGGELGALEGVAEGLSPLELLLEHDAGA